MSAQTTLPLAWQSNYDLSQFISAPSNLAAWRLASMPTAWTSPLALIQGGASSGKTHLSEIFRQNFNARAITSVMDIQQAIEDPGGCFVIDNADHLTQEWDTQKELFFLANAIIQHRGKLLLLAEQSPEAWIMLPDLLSRIKGGNQATILPPDDDMVRAAYQKLFADRGLLLDEQALTYLAYRTERSFLRIREIVDQIDQAALAAGRRVTRPFLTEVLDRKNA